MCKFYVQKPFFQLQFGFERTFVQKRTRKTLMKLTSVVNFTNIIQEAFFALFFCQKITKREAHKSYEKYFCMYEKTACTMLVKLTPVQISIIFRQ